VSSPARRAAARDREVTRARGTPGRRPQHHAGRSGARRALRLPRADRATASPVRLRNLGGRAAVARVARLPLCEGRRGLAHRGGGLVAAERTARHALLGSPGPRRAGARHAAPSARCVGVARGGTSLGAHHTAGVPRVAGLLRERGFPARGTSFLSRVFPTRRGARCRTARALLSPEA
jgi:hypothetical protein